MALQLLKSYFLCFNYLENYVEHNLPARFNFRIIYFIIVIMYRTQKKTISHTEVMF